MDYPLAVDRCPFCNASDVRETGAVTDGRHLLLQCRDSNCRGHRKWFASQQLVSKQEFFRRRENEERDRRRA